MIYLIIRVRLIKKLIWLSKDVLFFLFKYKGFYFLNLVCYFVKIVILFKL